MRSINQYKLHVILALFILIISSCDKSLDVAFDEPFAPVNITPNIISTKSQTSTFLPTLILNPTPTKTLAPTFTPPAPATTELPTGWEIREAFRDMESLPEIFQVDSNSRFQTGLGTAGAKQGLDFNGHSITVNDKDGDNDLVEIFLGQSKIMTLHCSNMHSLFGQNIISIWGYENHWMIEILCNDTSNIIYDGQFLNETNHYSSSFSPYFILNKLFYFFNRNNEVGFYYDGKEYILNYESIFYHYCCANAFMNPEFFNGQVKFYAIRGGTGISDDTYNYRYEVIMGVPISQ